MSRMDHCYWRDLLGQFWIFRWLIGGLWVKVFVAWPSVEARVWLKVDDAVDTMTYWENGWRGRPVWRRYRR